MHPIDLLWLIPVLPFAGAAINGLLAYRRGGAAGGGPPSRAAATAVALGSTGAALLLTGACLWQYLGSGLYPHAIEKISYTWIAGATLASGASGAAAAGGAFDGLQINVAFQLDPLSAVMLFVVTFVGFLIHLYSVGYMRDDPGYTRFFAYLNLFMAAMLKIGRAHV